MQTKDFKYVIIVSYTILLLAGCNKLNQLIPNEEADFTVKSFINSIKCDNATADFQQEKLPCDTTKATPFVSLQSWVVKGKDIAISVTLPDDATEIYIAATNAQADYLNLHFEGRKQDSITGYYRLPLNGLKSLRSTQTQLLKKANITSYKNYVLVLSSSENIQVSKFELHASYKTPQGLSNAAVVPVDVVSIAPYQKQLRVGFRPLKEYTYSITINIPDGKKITYNYNKTSGSESFNNTQSPLSKLSYDQQLDVNWIDIDPVFGNYSLIDNITIEVSGGSTQYVYVLLMVNAAGKIEQATLDANIQYSGGNTALGVVNFGFKYFADIYYEVPGMVPTINQERPMKCWAGCAAMMMSWRDNKVYTMEEAMSKLGQNWSDLFIIENKGLDENEIQLFFSTIGLKSSNFLAYSAEGIKYLLENHGPLFVITGVLPLEKDTWYTHARIVTGLHGDGSPSNTFLHINDPKTGAKVYESIYEFTNKYLNIPNHKMIQVGYY